MTLDTLATGVRAMLVVLFLLGAQTLLAQPAPRCEPSARPIESLLNPDGSLRFDHEFRGSVQARGWRIITSADGTPRFIPQEQDTALPPSSTLPAEPDDVHWTPEFGVPGVNGAVNALATGDDVVYVGGVFTKAGGKDANHIATWSLVTHSWSDVGGGVNGDVHAIAIDGENIYVGGEFTQAGTIEANNIACWNRTTRTWSALGAGTNGPVYAIDADGGSVYVGGKFTQAGGAAVSAIAFWSRALSAWTSPGGGVTRTGIAPIVYAIAVRGDEIYIGGEFTQAGTINDTNAIIWNRATSAWVSFAHGEATGFGGTVRAIAIRGDEVYIGGLFTRAMGTTTFSIVIFNAVTRRYSELGQRSRPGFYPGIKGEVRSIAVGKDGIYVGGVFTETAEKLPVRNVARWDGRRWRQMSTGVAGLSVNAVAAVGDRVFVGGNAIVAGDIIINFVGIWSGGAWSAMGNAAENGVNGVVNDMAVDGGTLYVAGEFVVAGGAPAQRIAKWNGTSWSGLSASGDNGPNGAVHAIAIDGGFLYAGGQFSSAGGAPARNIARWNMTTGAWSALELGVDSTVKALAAGAGRLYVGGLFDSAGSARARRLAVWNGGGWAPLGVGANGPVEAIAMSGDDLYIGGEFDSAGGVEARGIVHWNRTTSAWSALGAGVSGSPDRQQGVYAIALRGNDVYAGGEFTRAGETRANFIARWNRTTQVWTPIDSGAGRGVCNTVRALVVDGSNLYVGGEFAVAGNIGAKHIVKWDGTEWSALGVGLNNGTNDYVFALAAMPDGIYAGGQLSVAGGVRMNQISRWDGRSWLRLGSDPVYGVDATVHAMAIDGDDIYVGGVFAAAGDAFVNRVVKWNKKTKIWSMLGDGPDGNVHAITIAYGDVYVGGQFEKIGSATMNNIARWNIAANNWFMLGTPGSNGVNGIVYAITYRGNDIYVGGGFSEASGVPARNIARWNIETSSWSELGRGVDAQVFALTVGGMELFAGGKFTTAGDIKVNNIACWQILEGRWIDVGGGVSGTVHALSAAGDWVYVGGEFRSTGAGPADRIAAWNTSTDYWTTLGDGIPGNNSLTAVYSITATQSSVYVGGLFADAGGVQASSIAHWDIGEQKWSALGSGVGGLFPRIVYAMDVDASGLYAGGEFTQAGDKVAFFFGRWDKLTSSVEEKQPVTSAVVLDRNRPNPFSSSTDIEFLLDRPGHTRLKVYTLQGVELATLVDEHLTAGRHDVRWNAEGFPSGSYLCRLESGSEVRGMIVTVAR